MTNGDEDSAVNKRLSYHGSHRKYRISQRKRKSCPPAILSIGNSEEEKQQVEYYQKLADQHLYLGNRETASQYYSVLLDREFRKNYEKEHNPDENNNDVFIEDNDDITGAENRKWVEEYLENKYKETNEKINVAPKDAEWYLQKAAVLFFQDEWESARKVLEDGLSKCTKKTAIKVTLTDLNKLEKMLEKTSVT